MKDLKILEDPINKLKMKADTSADVTKKDVEFFITKNTESIETPKDIEESIKLLEEQGIIEIEDEKVTEIDKQQYKEIAGLNKKTKPLMEENFTLEAYRGFDKTEIAQEYADWLIEDCHIRPVWMGGRTLFYRLKKQTNTWEEVNKDLIIKKAKKDLRSQWTSHMKRELMNQFEHHHNFIEFEEMGLPENKVLLKDGTILNLETMDTEKVKPNDYALNCLNVSYNPEAEANGIKKFINETIDKEDMIKAFQEYLGYTLTWPSDDYEKILLILGGTDTGKSTLIEIVEELYGDATTTKLSFPQMGADRAFNVSKLKDSVLNIDTDMEDKDIKRKSRVKKLVTKEEIFVEDKGEDGYSMTSYANHIVTSNNAPDDKDATDAYYNRFITLTATSRIPEEEKDRQLADKLKSEENLQWLLNWAIEGLKRLNKQNKFSWNLTEYETKKHWDRFGNSVQKFISDQIIKDRENGKHVKTVDVYEIYQSWVDNKLGDEVSRNKFISLASSHPDMKKAKAYDYSGERAMCFKDIKVKDFHL